jgi:hypothetical protein
MTPETFNDAKHIFLIFPPGCGGNHLANLLSLHDEIENRFDSDNYIDEMLNRYRVKYSKIGDSLHSPPAHFSDLENLQPVELQKYTPKILESKHRYVFCCHASEYWVRTKDKSLSPFKDQIIVLFSDPTENRILKIRSRAGPWSKGEPMDYRNNSYTSELFCSKYKIDSSKVVEFNSDIYYTLSGFDYIQSIVKEHFGIELPEIARTMHDIYMKNQIDMYGSRASP